MSGISLVTHGWICPLRDVTIIRRCVLPLNLQIKETESINLEVKDVLQENINLKVEDKNVNLKLTEKNINIKKSDSTDINIDL